MTSALHMIAGGATAALTDAEVVESDLPVPIVVGG